MKTNHQLRERLDEGQRRRCALGAPSCSYKYFQAWGRPDKLSSLLRLIGFHWISSSTVERRDQQRWRSQQDYNNSCSAIVEVTQQLKRGLSGNVSTHRSLHEASREKECSSNISHSDVQQLNTAPEESRKNSTVIDDWQKCTFHCCW